MNGEGPACRRICPRDSRSFMWLEDLRRDVAYGVRTLLRTPSFTLVAVLTLALGISAVTVIYSVLRNVALDPFPYSRVRSPRQCRLARRLRPHHSRPVFPLRRSSSTIRSKPPRSRTSSAPASSVAALDERRRRRAPGAQLDDAERLRLSSASRRSSAASSTIATWRPARRRSPS